MGALKWQRPEAMGLEPKALGLAHLCSGLLNVHSPVCVDCPLTDVSASANPEPPLVLRKAGPPGLWEGALQSHLVTNTDSLTYSRVTLAQSLPPSEPQLSLSGQQG